MVREERVIERQSIKLLFEVEVQLCNLIVDWQNDDGGLTKSDVIAKLISIKTDFY